jgi:excisionase family DNA binding protein
MTLFGVTREVMDIEQCAEYLGISRDTLYKYAASGQVPAFKLGTHWRFKKSKVDAWMEKASAQSQSTLTDKHVESMVRQLLTQVPDLTETDLRLCQFGDKLIDAFRRMKAAK